MSDQPTPVERASKRLQDIALQAVDVCEELMTSADESAVRLSAAKTILDRAGLGPKTKLELSGETKNTHVIDIEIDALLTDLVRRKLPSGEEQELEQRLEINASPSAEAEEADLDKAIEAQLANG